MENQNEQIEYPAYNIYYLKHGTWHLFGDAPIVQQTLKEVCGTARMILNCSEENKAVRIYGIFNRKQTFIEEVQRDDFEDFLDGESDRYRKAMKTAVGICNDAIDGGAAKYENAILKMKSVLLDALAKPYDKAKINNTIPSRTSQSDIGSAIADAFSTRHKVTP